MLEAVGLHSPGLRGSNEPEEIANFRADPDAPVIPEGFNRDRLLEDILSGVIVAARRDWSGIVANSETLLTYSDDELANQIMFVDMVRDHGTSEINPGETAVAWDHRQYARVGQTWCKDMSRTSS
jgi:hypothetical protein